MNIKKINPNKVQSISDEQKKLSASGITTTIVKDKSVAKKEAVCIFLDGMFMSIVMTVLTIYALIGDDFRLMFFDKSADEVFYSISVVALFAFTCEVALNTYAREGYAYGFYFFLDFISALSLIPDIGWIWDALTESGDVSETATLRAGKASRAGTKASKIVRIVRLVRMVRIAKLFKMRNNKEDITKKEITEPSTVGKTLTELTTRRLIVLVLSMIIVLPLIDNTLDEDYNEFQEIGLENLHLVSQSFNNIITQEEMKDSIYDYITYAGPILAFQLTGFDKTITNEWIRNIKFQKAEDEFIDPLSEFSLSSHPINQWSSDNFEDDYRVVIDKLRTVEYIRIDKIGCYKDGKCTDCESNSPCESYAYFDHKEASQAAAFINLLKTFMIMIVLVIGVVLFTRDAQTLVIGPIERMMGLVKKLAQNPLATAKTEKEFDDEEVPDDYETAILEDTLMKIGSLLQVGFGVAGTEIIATNMGGAGELNVMIPGKKITSIFGFGIIERFTEMCSVLEEEIITYINTIADIVHTDTNTYFGAANKNIGPAFLLAWKICDGSLPGLRDPRDTDTYIMDKKERTKKREGISTLSAGNGTEAKKVGPEELVDSALAAILKMRVDIHLSNKGPDGKLYKFNSKPSVQSTFGDKFETHLGFGLHIGWAIEGAIGSRFKIDASYLSPNVNMAARLEAATGQFDIPLLISEWFVGELSDEARQLCRKIDRVTVKGSQIPMELWTFDIGNYDVPDFEPNFNQQGIQQSVKFGSDKIFQSLRGNIDPSFFTQFDLGVSDYLSGHWSSAKDHLEHCLKVKNDDGPTKLLLRVIAKHNDSAPPTWSGCRELTEK